MALPDSWHHRRVGTLNQPSPSMSTPWSQTLPPTLLPMLLPTWLATLRCLRCCTVVSPDCCVCCPQPPHRQALVLPTLPSVPFYKAWSWLKRNVLSLETGKRQFYTGGFVGWCGCQFCAGERCGMNRSILRDGVCVRAHGAECVWLGMDPDAWCAAAKTCRLQAASSAASTII